MICIILHKVELESRFDHLETDLVDVHIVQIVVQKVSFCDDMTASVRKS